MADIPAAFNYFRPNAERRELQNQVLTQISLACHWWKNAYMGLCPRIVAGPRPQYRDIWDLLENEPTPPLTPGAWNQFRPLFAEEASALKVRLNEALIAHGDILPEHFRKLIEETKLRMQLEQETYFEIPGITSANPPPEERFRRAFQGMVRQSGHSARRLSGSEKETET